MRIRLNSIIHLKSGIDCRVIGIPYHDKFYCRTADKKQEFKVVKLDDVEFVHSNQARLF